MHDQASRLRSLVRRSAWPQSEGTGAALPRVVAVAGGQSAVGSTTVAVNVAAAIAQLGWRAVLMDADERAPQVSARLGLQPRKTLAEVLRGECDVHEAILAGPAGLQVLPATDARYPAQDDAPALHQLLANLTNHTDIVLFDLGASREAWAQLLWRLAERVLLVTSSDAGALMDAYAAVKSIWQPGMTAAVQVLVNRESDMVVAAEVRARLDRSTRKFLSLPLEPGSALPECDSLKCVPTGAHPMLGCEHGPPAGLILERLAESLVTPAVTLSKRPAA